MKLKTIRGLVCLLTFIIAIVGLVVHTGMGTVSSLGWRDISAICPVGALEVLAGAKAFLVHPIVLLVLMVVVIVFVGRFFCSWMCPVPHIRNFFRPGDKDKKDKKGKKDAQAADAEGEGAEGAGASAEGAAASAEGADAPTPIVLEPEVALAGAKASAVPEGADDAPAEDADASASHRRRSKEPLAPVGGARDGFHFDSRHFVLLGTLVSSFAFGYPVFCLICPVGLSFAVVIGLWNMFRFSEVSVGLIVFPLLILAEVVLFRKWCTTLCPISALLSLIAAKSKFLRPVVQSHTCLRSKGTDCRTCVQVCPEQVDPHSLSIPECSRCGECIVNCPAHAIKLPFIAKQDAGSGDASGAAPVEIAEAKE